MSLEAMSSVFYYCIVSVVSQSDIYHVVQTCDSFLNIYLQLIVIYYCVDIIPINKHVDISIYDRKLCSIILIIMLLAAIVITLLAGSDRN